MRKYLKYLKYVIIHKWYVFIECCKLGIPIRGLLHDLSKFRLGELIPYARYFYGEESQKDYKDSHNSVEIGSDFDYAWLFHQHNNKHHWQYWILLGDSYDKKVLEMPEKYIREMVADWKGAGRAKMGSKADVVSWYEENKDKMVLHEKTRERVEELIDY